MKHATMKQENVGKINVSEDPRHGIISNQPRNDQNSSGMENVSAIKSLEELDIEKGEASLARQPEQTVVGCYLEDLGWETNHSIANLEQ